MTSIVSDIKNEKGIVLLGDEGMKETLETPTIVATHLDFAYGRTFKRFATASCSLKAVWQHHRQLF